MSTTIQILDCFKGAGFESIVHTSKSTLCILHYDIEYLTKYHATVRKYMKDLKMKNDFFLWKREKVMKFMRK